MKILKNNKVAFFIVICLAACIVWGFVSNGESNHIGSHPGTIIVTKQRALTVINGENLNESVDINLAGLSAYNNGYILNSYWDGEHILILEGDGKGDSTKWYFTILESNQKPKRVLLDSGRYFSIDKILRNDTSIVIQSNEKSYLIDIYALTNDINEPTEIRTDLELVAEKEYTVIFDNTINHIDTISSLSIDKERHRIEGLLSRPIQMAGIVDNYALIQIVPLTSNPDQFSWTAIYEGIKYDVDANTFAVLFLNLSTLTFENTNLSPTDTIGFYKTLSYTKVPFNKSKLEELSHHFTSNYIIQMEPYI